ncbi:MAG TPA: FG-GAP and VCBS repeat-containing protein, partial [Opitutales bacterium]|nr:FG-GAP and VCBS repeat-containing protein [Opitutales bacterium]
MKSCIKLLGWCALFSACPLFAAEQAWAGFGFGPPEVVKLDWSTRSLTPTDLDGDGLRDIAVINNDAGKIELLYQLPQGESPPEPKKSVNRSRWEPVLEDARFDKRSLTVGFPLFDMVAGDLNGDGRVDLAYTSGEVPLTVRYQGEDEEWVDSREFDNFEALGWANSIKVADSDGDGTAELFVLCSDAIRVFRQNPDGSLGEPQLFYVSGENPFNMMLFDVTADGLSDLLYLSTDGKQVLAMRKQIEGGQFGPEYRHVMERPARVIEPMASVDDGASSLAVVNSRSGSLEFMQLLSGGEESGDDHPALQSGSPEIYPIFNKVRESASYALGDVDGDGEEDLVVANPAEAELVLFAREKGRFQASKAFPSFSSVSSLSAGRFFDRRKSGLVVLSEREKTMGLSELDSNGRLSFPRQIKIGSGDPVVTATADLDGDEYDELLLINEVEGKYRLCVAAPADRADSDGSWNLLFEMELQGVRRKPAAMATMDVFASDTPGLILFVPREAPVLLRPSEPGKALAFEPVATESPVRESLLKALEPAETSIFDVDGDGVNELVVARTGFARAFRFSGEELEMVDQFNARQGSDVIDAVIPLRASGEIKSVALYVSAQRELQFLDRDSAGVF